jgi:hypothetical protein
MSPGPSLPTSPLQEQGPSVVDREQCPRLNNVRPASSKIDDPVGLEFSLFGEFPWKLRSNRDFGLFYQLIRHKLPFT